MSQKNRLFSPEHTIGQVGNINALVWELNRMGYRAGLHRTHPAADWLAECGVDIAKVLPGTVRLSGRAALRGGEPVKSRHARQKKRESVGGVVAKPAGRASATSTRKTRKSGI